MFISKPFTKSLGPEGQKARRLLVRFRRRLLAFAQPSVTSAWQPHSSLQTRPTFSCAHLKNLSEKVLDQKAKMPEGCLLLLSQVLRHRRSHIDHKRDVSGMQLVLAHSVKSIKMSLKMYVTSLFVRFEESCQRIKFNGLTLT